MPRPIGLITGSGIERPMTLRMRSRARVAPWRPVVVAGLLSVLVAIGLAWGLVSGRSSSAPSAGAARGGLSSLPAAARRAGVGGVGERRSALSRERFQGGF